MIMDPIPPSQTQLCNQITGIKQRKTSVSLEIDDHELQTKKSSIKQSAFEVLKTWCVSRKDLREAELDPNILKDSSISEYNRATLRLRIYEYCRLRQMVLRTASLAAIILDLYLCKNKSISISKLKPICLSCIRLANKLQDRVFNHLNPNVYDMRQVNEEEADICERLGYDLIRVTYVEIAQILMAVWKQFADGGLASQLNGHSGSSNSLNEVEKCEEIIDDDKTPIKPFPDQLLFQFLQFCYLDIESLRFKVQQLALNAFFLIFCVQMDEYPRNLTSSKVKKFYNNTSCRYRQFEKFVDKLTEITDLFQISDLEVSLGIYLYPLYNHLMLYPESSRQIKFTNRSSQTPYNNPSLSVPSFKQLSCIKCIFPYKDKSIRRFLDRKQRLSTRQTNAN